MIRLWVHGHNWEAPAAACTGVSHTARAGGSIGRDRSWAGGRMTKRRCMSDIRIRIRNVVDQRLTTYIL